MSFGLPQAQAASYYVSPSGSDTAPGTLAQPFLTIQNAATVMVAGDTAFIRAGTYRETVRPKNSGTQNAPITFMPYNGESVTISGADVFPANSWTLSGGSIYKAKAAWDLGPSFNQIFLDGRMMVEARWPNTTLDASHPIVAKSTAGSFIDGGTGLSTGTITDANLPARPDGYWTGATIHAALGAAWSWQTGSVVGSSANPGQVKFTFAKANDALVPGPANPYYLTGKLGELDSAGEWFLDGPSSTLYLWTPSNDSPGQHLVEAKHRQLAFDLRGKSFITVQGINIFAASIFSDQNSQYLLLDSLNLMYVSHNSLENQSPYSLGGTDGILLQGNNNVVRNSTIAYSSGSALTVGFPAESTNHSRVFNNTIHDVGYGAETAIIVGATGGIFAYNTIYNAGKAGITHSPLVSGRILHNEIHDVVLLTNDDGCTYSYESNGHGTEIAYNICHDVHGLLLNNKIPYANGIYLDEGTSNYVVHHNVVWNTQFAAALNSPSTNNLAFNNTYIGMSLGLSVYSASGPAQMPGTTIANNIFTAPLTPTPGATLQNNLLPGADPQFVDPAHNNYQLKPGSPAIGAGIAIPPYTNGYLGAAPDLGAYDHTKPAWKAGVQPAANVSLPGYAPTLTPGTVAVVDGSVPFDSGVSVLVTDGANVDLSAPLVYVAGAPPQLAFQVPSNAAPGVAMITITNGDGTISLSSAPLFAGAPPIAITATQGSGQSAAIHASFATPLQATVKSANGNPTQGVAVTFAAPATAAGGSFAASATVLTNSLGVAVAPAFTANGFAGSYMVTASAAGVGAPAVFNLTNTAPPAAIPSGGIAGVGGSVPAVQTLSQNGLISIFGQGFLPAGVTGRRVLPSEYVNGGLPPVLLGVCVDVGGKRAAMLDVYPTQINAQVPAVTGSSASVSVLTYCGTPAQAASAPQTVAVSAASPEFLYFQANASGMNPVVLVNAVTGALVGPSNILSGALMLTRATC